MYEIGQSIMDLELGFIGVIEDKEYQFIDYIVLSEKDKCFKNTSVNSIMNSYLSRVYNIYSNNFKEFKTLKKDITKKLDFSDFYYSAVECAKLSKSLNIDIVNLLDFLYTSSREELENHSKGGTKELSVGITDLIGSLESYRDDDIYLNKLYKFYIVLQKINVSVVKFIVDYDFTFNIKSKEDIIKLVRKYEDNYMKELNYK